MLSSNSPILRAPSIQKLMTLSNVSPPLEDTPLTMNPPPLLPRTEIYVTWSSMFHILTISMLCRGFSRYPIFFIIMTPVMRRAFKSPPSTWIVWYSTGFDGCFAMAKFPLDPNLFLWLRCVSPSYYNDPKGALFKLIQYKFINQYLSSLESSTNWIVGLPPHFFLS